MSVAWYRTAPFACLCFLALVPHPLLLAQPKSGAAIAIELSVGGDDGLTSAFATALKAAIARSADFAGSESKSREKLRLEIPTHIYWQKVRGRIHFQYIVILTNQESRYLGASIGQCWKDDMSSCAQTVLTEAREAW